MMTNDDPKGGIFLSHPHTNNGFLFHGLLINLTEIFMNCLMFMKYIIVHVQFMNE